MDIKITDLERIMREWGAIPGDWRHFFADLKAASINSVPDWSNAPEWANFQAQDQSGSWIYFEKKPEPMAAVWSVDSGMWAFSCVPGWKKSLQQRPKNPDQ